MTEGRNAPSLTPAAGLAILVVLALMAIFWRTGWSMVEIWERSGTFNHGFIIPPISIWLIWRKRAILATIAARPSIWGLLFFVGAAAAWVLADLLGIQVLAQLAFVSMLIAGVWTVLGDRLTWEISFALMFLYFGVPIGEGLVPPMMDFTAYFSANMIEMTGIPVYREGLLLTVPNGRWSIVEACSGVRYLIAAVTLGVLWAYLTYQSLWRRLLFVALSIVVPIIANGFRAYMIIMIGYLSDMTLAVGVDHLLYGWVLFGLVMMLLFWIGSWFAEPPASLQPGEADPQPSRIGIASAVLVLALAVGTQASLLVLKGQDHELANPLVAPQSVNGWIRTDAEIHWRPNHEATDHTWRFAYRKGQHLVEVWMAWYPWQDQGYEAVSWLNSVIPAKGEHGKRDPWRQLSSDPLPLADEPLLDQVVRHKMRFNGDSEMPRFDLTVWQWYRQGEHESVSPLLGKLLELRNRFLAGRSDGAYLAVAVRHDWRQAEGSEAEVLRAFIQEVYPAMEQALDHALGKNG